MWYEYFLDIPIACKILAQFGIVIGMVEISEVLSNYKKSYPFGY